MGTYTDFFVVFGYSLWSAGVPVRRVHTGERCGGQRFAVVQGRRQRRQVRPFPAYLEVQYIHENDIASRTTATGVLL